MSRALDQDTAALVLTSDPQAAYHDILEALNTNTSSLLDIEFLGKDHPLPPGCNVLVDGTSIGVPKFKLVQAFVIARQIFFNCLNDFQEDKFQDIRNASAIILLMDPEHITAANARKRIIQHLRTSSEENLQHVLRGELLIIDSFLTSRLHRHTKSPTLWGHRRWLLQLRGVLGFPRDIQWDLEAVVLVAAERHPRNYYAWLHLRWLVHGVQGRSDGSNLPATEHSKIISVVKDWCLRHPADTSGWSFLMFYLFYIEPLESTRFEANSSVCKEVLHLAISFEWSHESVWVYLRTLIASRKIQEDQRSSFFKTVEAILVVQPENPRARKTLKAAHNWCAKYST